MSDRKTMVVVLVSAAIAIGIVLVLLLRSDHQAATEAAGPESQHADLEGLQRSHQNLQAELQRLAAENQRLARTNQQLEQELERGDAQEQQPRANPPAQAPVPRQVAAPQPTAAQIAGSVWLTRNDGSSNVQRGLPIHLLKPQVDGGTVRRALEGVRNEYLQLAQREQQQAEREREKEFKVDGLMANFYERQAAQYERKANQIAQQLRQVPASMAVSQFYDLLNQAMTMRSQYGPIHISHPYLSQHVQGLVVASARTDVEGRYQFEDVPPGAYFLWAEMDTRAMYVDWLIPLRVTTQPLSLDLHNDNAATIRNVR